jgi:DNA-binding response OmpR family regulator
VLVAEDSQLLATLLTDALKAHSVAEQTEAHKTADAFYAALERRVRNSEPVSLMIIDINMPGENGLSLGRRVRELERSVGAMPAPIVFFSSRESDPEIVEAVAECFPARFVHKTDASGPGMVAFEGAMMMKKLMNPGMP